jgi:hypothetical protein
MRNWSRILPFFIGVQTAPLLTLQFEIPWMARRFQDAFFTALPIFLIQSAGQIYQVVGDYETDSMAKISARSEVRQTNFLKIRSHIAVNHGESSHSV